MKCKKIFILIIVLILLLLNYNFTFAASDEPNLVSEAAILIDSNTNKNLKMLLDKDILATNIYTLCYKKSSFGNLDFTKKIIVR